MKRQKRDRGDRAYSRGYLAGLQGRSRDCCPFMEDTLRLTWINGWREGRDGSWKAANTAAPLMQTG